MIDEFRSVTLSQAAHQLGVDPFEVVRLAQAIATVPDDLRFSAALIAQLRADGGITTPWNERSLPEDTNPIRAAVRGALTLLAEGGFVGANTTRLDNLSRGLTNDQQDAVTEACVVLAEEEALAITATAAGQQVSIVVGQEGIVARIADGSSSPESLSLLWAE